MNLIEGCSDILKTNYHHLFDPLVGHSREILNQTKYIYMYLAKMNKKNMLFLISISKYQIKNEF